MRSVGTLACSQGRVERVDWDHMAVWLVLYDYPSMPLSPSWANTSALFALCCNSTWEHGQPQPRKISKMRCCGSSNLKWQLNREQAANLGICRHSASEADLISDGSQAATTPAMTLVEYPASLTPTLLPLWAEGARARTQHTLRQSFCSNNLKHESWINHDLPISESKQLALVYRPQKLLQGLLNKTNFDNDKNMLRG